MPRPRLARLMQGRRRVVDRGRCRSGSRRRRSRSRLATGGGPAAFGDRPADDRWRGCALSARARDGAARRISAGSTGARASGRHSPRSSAPVTTKAVDRQNVPSAAISTIGSFFGKYGMFDTTAREMMRASAGAAAMLSRARRLAIFGQIGFEQVALRLGFALERAQLHVLIAGRRGLPLELVEIAAEACSSRAPATLASFSSERASRSPSARIC